MDVFSSLMAVGECLLDEHRTRAFEQAIREVVQPGDRVLDVGTGSGILAMFSARAGARHVTAIDLAPELIRLARANMANNGFASVIDVRQCDAKSFATDEPVDVVTMELLDTWLVAEQQVAALNAAHANGTIGPRTRLIPYRYQCLVELVDYDFSMYGFRMPFVIQARNGAVTQRVRDRMSAPHVARDVSFHEQHSLDVRLHTRLEVTKAGCCNAAVLSANLFLGGTVRIGSTSDMNMPVVVPLEDRLLASGESVVLRTAYTMGGGFGTFVMGWA
jgi:predicted RNA methylase